MSFATNNLAVGGTLTVTGNVVLNGNLTTVPYSDLFLTGRTASTNTTTGTLVLTNGGAGIVGNIYCGNSLNVAGSITNNGGILGGGNLITTNSSGSVSTTSGALIVNGGVGIGGNIYVGNVLNISGNGILVVGNSAGATGLLDGAVRVSGGVGISGNLIVGNVLTVSGNGILIVGNSAGATGLLNGAMRVSGGVGISGNLVVGNVLTVSGNGIMVIANTTAASSTTTGVLQVAGGAGIAGSLYLGSNLVFSNTNVGSYVPTPLSYYEESNYTITWQWASGTNTSTALITRIGRVVTLTFNSPIIVGTGGVANPGGFACYSQNFPARFAPTTGVNIACPMPINNGSAYVMGCASINTNPTIYLNTGLYHGSGSGTAGAGAYLIGVPTNVITGYIYSITYTLV